MATKLCECIETDLCHNPGTPLHFLATIIFIESESFLIVLPIRTQTFRMPTDS